MIDKLDCGGHLLTHASVHVSRRGPWYVDLDFTDEAVDVSGRATLTAGPSKLVGTIVTDRTGTFGLQRRARLVAGAGSWGKALSRKAYANDAQVNALMVAQDAARDAGETLGAFDPAETFLAPKWVRVTGAASRTLEAAAGVGRDWWVGFDGVTHVGVRPSAPVNADAVRVLHYDPRRRVAELDVDDLAAVTIGSIITAGVPEPITVGALTFELTAASMRAFAYVGGEAHGRIADALRAIVERATDAPLHGHYRYRVVNMNGDRVDLQAVRSRTGVPDLVRCEMWPGVSGTHARLTPGTECAVAFLDGDPGQPAIVAFVGKTGPGAVPASLELCGNDLQAARMGDLVLSGGPGLVVTLVPVLPALPAPPNAAVACGVPHYISFSPVAPLDATTGADCVPLPGAIMSGSPRVAMGAA